MIALLKNNFISTSFGTSISKLIGLARQILIAAAFGVGITYDAFNYAYIIPGFFAVIIGGINGPLHNAIVAVLTPLNNKKAGSILFSVSLKLMLILSIVGLIIYANANYLIGIIGPDLNIETKLLAIRHLRILCPCIPLSAFVGLSFGALNAKNRFLIPSLSPAIISITTIIFILLDWLFTLNNNLSIGLNKRDLLALATLTGTFFQCSIQFIETRRINLLKPNLELFKFKKLEVRIFKLIIPTTLSSGVGQINVLVDMFFVSGFQGAASALAYGNFLIQAPLGILSNSLILPLLPKLSQLVSKNGHKEFINSLVLGIESCFLTTFFLSGMFILFNEQIIEIIFQRGAFNYEAAILVKKVIIAYAIGIPFYLFRDLIVRAYYILEKTKLPFQLSFAGIILNVFFDWILIGGPINNSLKLFSFNYGVIGIVISSGIVNFIISMILLIRLKVTKKTLPLNHIANKTSLIFISCSISVFVCNLIFNEIFKFNNNFSNTLIYLFSGLTIYLVTYFFTTKMLKVNNINLKKII